MTPNAAILAIRIRSEMEEIARVVERTLRLLNKAIDSQDEDYYDGVALNLHSFYTAIERILEDIAREVDRAVPTGPEWHRDLLTQMSAAFPGTRPRVLERTSRNCLNEYRGLRHVIRKVYTFNLKPSRLQELVTMLPGCHTSLVADLNRFCDFLETLDESHNS
ncbi:MAG: hypothetical protein Fur0046_24140 [Cyanobacteria bacterium J069]|nr:MAG: hypothetical protein D6742_15775 [Cyanobacteria bacterium J069]